MKALAKESLNLVKAKAPVIVNEQIIPQILDEVAGHTGDLLGRITNLPADDETAITMAHGIIYDGLLHEVIDQTQRTMLRLAGKRLKKFKKLSK